MIRSERSERLEHPGRSKPTDQNPSSDQNDSSEPSVSQSSELQAAVREAFSDAGALARVLDGYEPREGQRLMSEAVASVVEKGGTLLAEAGTGTGKTLAYLVPSILSGRRVLVS